ncbi:MAG: outer membrane protein assembly factor BamB [Pirellulaceae bacterium]|jgi:outer membrane protein assembly factor BamB
MWFYRDRASNAVSAIERREVRQGSSTLFHVHKVISGLVAICLVTAALTMAQRPAADVDNFESYKVTPLRVGGKDWPMWCGSSLRNNVPVGKDIPTDWAIGKFDRRTGAWDRTLSRNIKWVANLGSQTYSPPIVANGKIFIGSNNGQGHVKRYPRAVDLGCMLCFEEETGKFLWQHSCLKLATGRVHDWPMQGIVSTPVADGDRLWYVTNRGEIICADANGFHDGQNDGWAGEKPVAKDEADIVWRFDMMKDLGISQHNLCCSSPALADGVLFVVTSNGVDESHINIPMPNAPAFIALDAKTGRVLWTDNTPGEFVLHGQWSSPSYAVLGGVPQVLFPGGDGWLYSFAPRGDGESNAKLLWKFDGNPKTSKWVLGGRGKRNEHITVPVIYDQKVYVAMGQDVEHGEGQGDLWCIDPAKYTDGSDVSPTLGFAADGTLLKRRRLQAVDVEEGEYEEVNPKSALVWHYSGKDYDGDGEIEIMETMNRTCAPVAIKDDLLIVSDFSGFLHCLDAQTGEQYWVHDLYAATYAAAPLIVEDKIYVADEDGDILIAKLGKKFEAVSYDNGNFEIEPNMDNSVYSTPVVANDTLYISSKNRLFAIKNSAPKEADASESAVKKPGK